MYKTMEWMCSSVGCGSGERGSGGCGSGECGSAECGSVRCVVSSGCIRCGSVSDERCSSLVRVHPPRAGGRPEWEWFPKSPSLSLPPPSHQWRGPVLHSQRIQQCKRQSRLGNKGRKEDDDAISIFSSLHHTMGAHTAVTLHRTCQSKLSEAATACVAKITCSVQLPHFLRTTDLQLEKENRV